MAHIHIPFFSFLSKLSKRDQLIFYVGLMLVFALLLERNVLSPVLSKLEQLDKEIDFQKEVIHRSMIVLSHKDRLLENEKIYSTYLSVPDSEEKETNTFLKEVENIAKESRIYLISVKSTGVRTEGKVRQYFLTLDFEGKMEDLIGFFHAIETSKTLLKIERFQIKPKTERSNIVLCTVDVSKVIVPK